MVSERSNAGRSLKLLQASVKTSPGDPFQRGPPQPQRQPLPLPLLPEEFYGSLGCGSSLLHPDEPPEQTEVIKSTVSEAPEKLQMLGRRAQLCLPLLLATVLLWVGSVMLLDTCRAGVPLVTRLSEAWVSHIGKGEDEDTNSTDISPVHGYLDSNSTNISLFHGHSTAEECSVMHDTELVTRTTIKLVPSTSSYVVCSAACSAAPNCRAWTWGHGPHFGGGTGVCLLKRLEADEHPARANKIGAVSGILCEKRHAALASQLTHNRRAPAPGAPLRSALKPMPTAPTSMRPTSRAFGGANNTVLRLAPDEETLFCFSLMVLHSFEADLLVAQYQERAGIFSCDDYTVYSNQSAVLNNAVSIRAVHMNLHCERGGEFHTPLNVDAFGAIWDQVVKDGIFRRHDWTAKVDPDCVFLPQRLRGALPIRVDSSVRSAVYLNNCRFGLQGALEVLSRAAVQALAAGWDRCRSHFRELCGGRCMWGEDLFADQCLDKVLKVQRIDALGLLSSSSCGAAEGWDNCHDPSRAAFHPFRDLNTHRLCLRHAAGQPRAFLHLKK